DDCNRKTRLCVGSAKTRLMATDETEKQQKQNPEPFRVGSVSANPKRIISYSKSSSNTWQTLSSQYRTKKESLYQRS
ncbi:MAG: hypothetical protein QW177_06700, partial [Candidatus Nitrosotenuis sp.]